MVTLIQALFWERQTELESRLRTAPLNGTSVLVGETWPVSNLEGSKIEVEGRDRAQKVDTGTGLGENETLPLKLRDKRSRGWPCCFSLFALVPSTHPAIGSASVLCPSGEGSSYPPSASRHWLSEGFAANKRASLEELFCRPQVPCGQMTPVIRLDAM